MAELGNKLWDDVELAVFSDQQNKKAYQDALNQAKADSARHNKEIYEGLNPLESFATWLVNGLSGQGNEADYLKTHGFTDEVQQAGEAGLLDQSTLNTLRGETERNLTKEMEKGTGATAGLQNVPIIGGILDYLVAPVAQTAGAGQALNKGIGGDWSDWNKRDTVSDIAALGQVLSNAATAGIGAPSTLGGKIAAGAVLGGVDNALDTLRQQGSDINMGDLLSSTAVGAGFGAAIPALGAGAKKLGSSVANTGRNAIANQAMQQGYGQAMANQIAQNTGRGTQIAAGLGKTIKSKPFKIGAGAVAGGTLLSNLLGNRNANQTGYNDDATYGSDLYGTTQGYNYGTYGY